MGSFHPTFYERVYIFTSLLNIKSSILIKIKEFSRDSSFVYRFSLRRRPSLSLILIHNYILFYHPYPISPRSIHSSSLHSPVICPVIFLSPLDVKSSFHRLSLNSPSLSIILSSTPYLSYIPKSLFNLRSSSFARCRFSIP